MVPKHEKNEEQCQIIPVHSHNFASGQAVETQLSSMQFEMRLQTVVGEFYSEVGDNFNFEKP